MSSAKLLVLSVRRSAARFSVPEINIAIAPAGESPTVRRIGQRGDKAVFFHERLEKGGRCGRPISESSCLCFRWLESDRQENTPRTRYRPHVFRPFEEGSRCGHPISQSLKKSKDVYQG